MVAFAAALPALSGMMSSGMSMASTATSILAPLAMSALQKTMTVLAFVLLFLLVVFIYVVVVHIPPRSWKLSHVGENTANEIMDKTYEMVVRLEEEYGEEIQEWLEGERAENSSVYRVIVKEWHLRADESYINRTYIMANTAIPNEKYCDGLFGRPCEETNVGCERPETDDDIQDKFEGQDVKPKDFPEKVFDQCPRVGTAPCYRTDNTGRRREGDLFFGTPKPLNMANLRDDFEIWFNLEENDPVKQIMEKDKTMLESIENVELFMAALPWFMRHVQKRYAIFKYCTPEEIMDSQAWIKGESTERTMFLRKYHVFKADPESRRDLACRLGFAPKVIGLTEEDLFDSVMDDPELIRALLRRTLVNSDTDLDDKEKLRARVFEILDEEKATKRLPLLNAASCRQYLEEARGFMEKAKEFAEEGNMGQARRYAHDASESFTNAIDRLILLKQTTDARLNFLSLSAYPTLENRKAAWDNVLDLMNYDDEDIEDAYRAVETIQDREIMKDCSGDKTSVLERDYKRYINLVHAVVYTGTYVAESKKYANIYHLNREVAKRFYEIMYNDLRCAYQSKVTFKPHVSETGLIYNVQSTYEFASTFWKWNDRWEGLKKGLKAVIDTTSDACGF